MRCCALRARPIRPRSSGRPRKPAAAKNALNILVMGSDTRKGQGPAIKGAKKAATANTKPTTATAGQTGGVRQNS